MNYTFAMLNTPEIILIFAVILVLFGAKKLPELARGLGQGLKEFKKASREMTDEIQASINDDDRHQPPSRRVSAELERPQELPASTTPASTPVPAATQPHSENPPTPKVV